MKTSSKKINHKQVVKMVCEHTGDNEKEVQKHIDSYIEVIMKLMCKGNNIGIKHLGTMKVEKAAETTAWDFKTQQNVIRPNRVLPKMSFNRKFSSQIKRLNK